MVSTEPDQLQRFTFTEYHMGVDTRLVVYAENADFARTACADAFERIAKLDTMMSDYRVDSELNKLSDKAGTGPIRVSPELFTVLEMAQRVSKDSNGLFDVTIGPLVQLWRKARKTHVLPTLEDIEKARKLVDWRMLKLDKKEDTVQLLKPGMRLDLGAIAKGYADDEAQKVLWDHGVSRALVEMGGDIVVTGAPPGKKGWTIRVPNMGKGKGPQDIQVANKAISTSGDTEQFVIIGGKRYSHVVNPHTGQALTSRVEATVLAPTGLLADPISTAVTLLPEKDRTKFLKGYPDTKAYVRVMKGAAD